MSKGFGVTHLTGLHRFWPDLALCRRRDQMTSCGLPSLIFPVKVKVLKLLKHCFPILSFISNKNKKN